MKYDFSGYATKNDLKCSDGRTIRSGAFKENDGGQVPLLWQHGHSDSMNVLGHAVLENRPDGVYAYGKFNETEQGKNARLMVQHGDIVAMSIYANSLVEDKKNVLHGSIKEVSLVLAGANPGALIDNVVLQHGDEEMSIDEAVIYTGLELEHTDTIERTDVAETKNEGKTIEQVIESYDEDQRTVLDYLVGKALEVASGNVEHSSDSDKEDDKNKSDSSEDKNIQHNQEGTQMGSHNVFDGADKGESKTVLTHDQMSQIMDTAKKAGHTLKDAVIQHAGEYGIQNIDVLFPDAKAVMDRPEFIARRTEWVSSVLSGTKHSPFSRIKSLLADITHEEARAKGYIKGNMKKEEFFAVARRVTTPTTIYKKQKLDRDDIIDIVDFDVVVWLKAEMRLMLDEEIARAVLVGDGREVDDDDKINEINIRPIATDSELYAHPVYLDLSGPVVDYNDVVDQMIAARSNYRGSGTPTLYTTEALLTSMLLTRDGQQRRMYRSVSDLASELRVTSVVAVEVMEEHPDVIGIMVNLSDYTIGADKGGQVTMFDDFDIDYNQNKYLIETRISGALTKYKSALVFRNGAAANVATPVAPEAPTFDAATNIVTIPASTKAEYIIPPGSPLEAGPVQLKKGQTVQVKALPKHDNVFTPGSTKSWTFTYEG